MKGINKQFIIILCGIIVIVMGLFVYQKWFNVHGWVVKSICIKNCKDSQIDSFLVIDSNVKSAILRVEEYLESNGKDIGDFKIEVVRYIGKKPWNQAGVKLITKESEQVRTAVTPDL